MFDILSVHVITPLIPFSRFISISMKLSSYLDNCMQKHMLWNSIMYFAYTVYNLLNYFICSKCNIKTHLKCINSETFDHDFDFFHINFQSSLCSFMLFQKCETTKFSQQSSFINSPCLPHRHIPNPTSYSSRGQFLEFYLKRT